MIEPMTSLAFSVYSAKGVYALLLGSGVSRSSGMPTGWEIVLDLIEKTAAVEGKVISGDAEAWYKATYGEAPDYSKLLEGLAPESANRRELLDGYFEPTEQEREDGKKQPTKAHRAIARLVKSGYIRVIVTTNFDRLMEQALQAEGITPTVVSSVDGISGAVPLPHAPCTVVKLHGDYKDPRLKNTPTELEGYDPALNSYLDRILDEYGLIVCGWSADWDVALRHAIERCPNRRYATYWSAYSKVTPMAKELCDKRAAHVVTGMGADEFFEGLAEKVSTLESMSAPHPLSVPMAIAQTKQYLAEARHRIKLHDLVMGETQRVHDALFSADPAKNRERPLTDYEPHLTLLAPMLATGGYYGGPKQRRLWVRCLELMAKSKIYRADKHPLEIDNYPAYYLLYAFCMGAVASGRIANMAYLLSRARLRQEREDIPLLKHLVSSLLARQLDWAAKQIDTELNRTTIPASKYLLARLREPLRLTIPSDQIFEDIFVSTEYLICLVTSDLYAKSWGNTSFGAFPGLYLGRRDELHARYSAEIAKHGEKWPMLRAGLFDGSLDRLQLVNTGIRGSLGSVASQCNLF